MPIKALTYIHSLIEGVSPLVVSSSAKVNNAAGRVADFVRDQDFYAAMLEHLFCLACLSS